MPNDLPQQEPDWVPLDADKLIAELPMDPTAALAVVEAEIQRISIAKTTGRLHLLFAGISEKEVHDAQKGKIPASLVPLLSQTSNEEEKKRYLGLLAVNRAFGDVNYEQMIHEKIHLCNLLAEDALDKLNRTRGLLRESAPGLAVAKSPNVPRPHKPFENLCDIKNPVLRRSPINDGTYWVVASLDSVRTSLTPDEWSVDLALIYLRKRSGKPYTWNTLERAREGVR